MWSYLTCNCLKHRSPMRTTGWGGSPYIRYFPDGTRCLRIHYILGWRKLYTPLLMLSIEILRAQSHLAVPFN